MLTLVLTLASLLAVTLAFPNGARIPQDKQMDSMCTTGNQRPFHTTPDNQLIMPQPGPAPVTLTARANNNPYRSGSVFRVILKAARGQTFKGFFITADAEDAKFGVKGVFSAEGPHRTRAKSTMFCSPGITHTNSQPKNQVVITYRVPANFTHGTIQFKATVVMDHAKFYTGVLSNSVNATRTGGVKTETQYTMSRLSAMGNGGMGAMGGPGGIGGLLGGFDLTGMMQNMMKNMPMGGGPMMNPQGGSPMVNRGRGGMQG